MVRAAAAMMVLLAAACTSPPGAIGPPPVYDPDSDLFFGTPWPSDDRLDEDGTLDVAGFPNPYNITVLNTYLARADATVGFGTNSPVYVLFEDSIDPVTLPTPAESLQPGSSLVLVDVDPASPYWGERIPVQWEQNHYEGSVYMPEHLLAVAPVFGFPLRPATKYALIVTTGAASPAEGWTLDDPDLEQALFALDLRRDEIAIATTFTTTDPVAELATIARYVQERIAPADLDREPLEHIYDHVNYTAWRARYRSPIFTHGVPPYMTEGGQFEFDEAGDPVVASFDELRVAVCTPHGEEPEGGWPVVIYQHGTGGAYRGFCNSSSALEVMNRLGTEGFIGLGLDQPLHGSRPGAEEANDVAHFNIINPDSGITNFRQGAIDAIYLARSLASRGYTFRAPDGRAYRTDPDRILFMGHSQGGLTGALAAPFVGNDLRAMVLSGAGGVLAITIVERKDPLDFAALVRNLVQIGEGEPLTPLHPTLGMIQTLVEPTDPANYAPYWFSQPGSWPGHAPVPVLLTSGTADTATPYRTAIALAAAGRLPFVGIPATAADALALRDCDSEPLPSRLNARCFDGRRATSGFHQWWGGTHFVVFEEQDASDLYTNYLRSTADGEPTLWLWDAPPPGVQPTQ